MNTKAQYTTTLCTMFLLVITSNAQACYYEGDPVLTPSGYNVPKASFDKDCYYGGDPVMEKSGQYDTPVILAEGSYYYLAEIRETGTVDIDAQDKVDFSAFEFETEKSVNRGSDVTRQLKTNNAIDSGEHSWTPEEWDRIY